jgi:hypothetical protein
VKPPSGEPSHAWDSAVAASAYPIAGAVLVATSPSLFFFFLKKKKDIIIIIVLFILIFLIKEDTCHLLVGYYIVAFLKI